MDQTQPIFSILPILFCSLPFIFLNQSVARKKGKSSAMYGVLGAIFIVNFFCYLYLISLPDKSIVEKLDKLLERGNTSEEQL